MNFRYSMHGLLFRFEVHTFFTRLVNSLNIYVMMLDKFNCATLPSTVDIEKIGINRCTGYDLP